MFTSSYFSSSAIASLPRRTCSILASQNLHLLKYGPDGPLESGIPLVSCLQTYLTKTRSLDVLFMFIGETLGGQDVGHILTN